MNQFQRTVFGPFASAAAGGIIAIVIAIVIFGIQDQDYVKYIGLFGAALGAIPEVLRLLADIVKTAKSSRRLPLKKSTKPRSSYELAIEEAAKVEQAKVAAAQEARRKLLADEHEARRPICSHCNKKTEPIFLHRRSNGSQDMRYRKNPLLCNKCYKPYAGVRPWNLPDAKSDS